jgi:hypothetical protein
MALKDLGLRVFCVVKSCATLVLDLSGRGLTGSQFGVIVSLQDNMSLA